MTQLQSAERSQWLTLSSRFPESLPQLNDTLRSRTYLLDTQAPSTTDAVVFSRVLPLIKEWSVDQIKESRHVIRWADLIQHTLKVEDGIKVDLDLEVARELKAKPEKKKKEGATAAKDTKEPSKEEATKEEAKGKEQSKEGEGKKKEKKEKKKKPEPVKKELVITPGLIDLRVGHIVKAIKHPDADSLYVSTIDVGEPEPRTVCSGLVKHFPLEAMQDRYVVVVANLKPVNMRGIKSQAMVLCANDAADGKVEFVNPPPGSKAGDKIFFEGYDETPEPVLNPKKKIWETVQPLFTTNEGLEVVYRKEGEADRKLVNKNGELCKVESLANAGVR